ncbi:MAG TPA: hypothetical protein VFK13_02225 [Gemmatimonadaceae bacterium]|nr:hypothetical protein [Gemmatimonadaceae bacterium]
MSSVRVRCCGARASSTLATLLSVAIFAAMPWLTGCAQRADASRTVVVDTAGGVVHVHNPARGSVWRLRLLATVADLADSTAILRAGAVTADSAGRIYVADARAGLVRVFDSTGHLVRTIGRRGTGDGEFRRPLGLGWLGDTLVVLDGSNARLALVSRDGAWLGAWPHGYVGNTPAIISTGDERELYARVEGAASAVAGAWYRRVTPAGPTNDTLHLPRGAESPAASVVCLGGTGIMTFDIPSAPQWAYTFAHGGYTVASPDNRYHITFIDQRGDTVRTVDRPAAEIEAGSDVWQHAADALAQYERAHPGARCTPPRMPRVRTERILGDLFTDADGRLWVERRATAAERATLGGADSAQQDAGGGTPNGEDAPASDSTLSRVAVLDVLDGEGKLLGTMPAPVRELSVLPYASGDRLYVVARVGGRDVVRVYRIERGT